MGGYVLWYFLTITLLVGVATRSTFVLNFICVFPSLLTILFHVFKNMPVSNQDKANFFAGLNIGGHRGSPYEAPENTIEGFAMAKHAKCELVEFDIHLSADGVPVLIHDESTGRTSKEDIVVKKATAKEIQNVPLKIVSGIKSAIPTLAEAVDWCLQNNMKMIFDIKDADPKMIQCLASIVKSKNLYAKAVISSFNPCVAFTVKRVDKNILTGLTSRSGYLSYEDDDRRIPRNGPPLLYMDSLIDDLIAIGIRSFVLPIFLGVDMLLLHHKCINSNFVEDARQLGIHVLAWTVNESYQATFLRFNNVPFLTDYPQLLKGKQ
ncbi:Glycerophosphodiester phosphodiesterase family protein [Trichostrongylus colubriformis]|uniref:Glycerophosphodiester phosphodiesterase family protein n=1 Tax=Trichostrongylus colubriformis TaxID=6319 RepID=A0AAN8II09_TRICO